MKKSIKSFVAMLFLILAIFQLPNVAFAQTSIPSATSDFYVNDFANVFSNDEKTRLMDNAVALSNEHDGIQVVVTTIESLDGDSAQNYALEMYNSYGIGKDDMGLLILLSTSDRQIRVEVGKAMESYINDSKAGRFIDKYAIPSLKEDKFNEGLINLQEALISEITTSVEAETSSTIQSSDSKGNIDFVNNLGIVLVLCIITMMIILVIMAIQRIIKRSKEKQHEINMLTIQLRDSEWNNAELKSANIKEVHRLEEKIENLLDDKEHLSSDYKNLDKKYKTLKDRYNRVQVLYPTADTDVTNMIEEEIRKKDMELANKADTIIQKLISHPASKDIVDNLSTAKHCYSLLNKRQKSYVKSDITKLDKLYDESLKLKNEYDNMLEVERRKKLAAAAVVSITAIISCISIGTSSNLGKLKSAKSIYDALDSKSKSYFESSVLEKLNKLYKQALKDKENKEEQEEAERRRRRQREEDEERRRRMQSSNSSFSSGSHYGGFGGHSGGGGASRGF